MINGVIIEEHILFKNRTIKSLSLHKVMKQMFVILFVKGQVCSSSYSIPSEVSLHVIRWKARLAIPIKIK